MNKIINKDCIEGMKELADNSIDCCVTSPPYFGLRDYGHEGQAGLEETPELYVEKMVEVFTEVKRVLKKEGTLWLNLGDSYFGGGRGNTSTNSTNEKHLSIESAKPKWNFGGYKPKDLIGVPWMVAFALRSSGWYLRQDIIWNKPNPMPESVTDRCTKAHEYIFLLSKSSKYYYDADAIKTLLIPHALNESHFSDGSKKEVLFKQRGITKGMAHKSAVTPGQSPHTKALNRMNGISDPLYEFANKRSVWTVTTKPYSEAHFATFPEDLIVDMIKAGCPEGGIVLDPFMGAGTTALVASKLNINFIGFELNAEYVKITNKRLQNHLGFFNPAYQC